MISSAPKNQQLDRTVAHALETPLTTIHLYTESLLTGDVGPLTSDQKKYLQEIYDAAKRMVAYIESLPKYHSEKKL